MDAARFGEIINKQIKTCMDILVVKAEEYATEDRLHNFKVAARLEGITPVEALGGMMAKHTVSVYDLIRDYGKRCDPQQQPWIEKITDHINYLLLLRALLEECDEC